MKAYEDELKKYQNCGVVVTQSGNAYWVPKGSLLSGWSKYCYSLSQPLAKDLNLSATKRSSGYMCPANGVVLFKDIDEVKAALAAKGEKEEMQKLYEVTQGDMKRYASKLAVNSSGQWVMEEKGTGSVFTADPKTCEEVKPYTIEVMTTGGSKTTFTAEKGKYQEGEVYWYDQGFVVVRRVDTKQDSHQGEFKPKMRVLTEKV